MDSNVEQNILPQPVQQPSQPVQPQPQSPSPQQPSNTVPIIIAVICLLGIGLLGGYLFATRNESQTPNTNKLPAEQKLTGSNPFGNNPSVNGVQSDTATAKHDGITMTITPNSGPVGSLVTVTLEGVPPPPIFLEGGIIFVDSASSIGYPQQADEKQDTQKSDPPDPEKLHKTTFTIKIPDTVYVKATPTEQRPSKAVNISPGQGMLRYLYNDGTTKSDDGGYPHVDIPFTITSPL